MLLSANGGTNGTSPDLWTASLAPRPDTAGLAQTTAESPQGAGAKEQLAVDVSWSRLAPEARSCSRRSCSTRSTRSASSRSCAGCVARARLQALVCNMVPPEGTTSSHQSCPPADAMENATAPAASANGLKRVWPCGDDSPPSAIGFAPGRAHSGRPPALALRTRAGDCTVDRRKLALPSARASTTAAEDSSGLRGRALRLDVGEGPLPPFSGTSRTGRLDRGEADSLSDRPVGSNRAGSCGCGERGSPDSRRSMRLPPSPVPTVPGLRTRRISSRTSALAVPVQDTPQPRSSARTRSSSKWRSANQSRCLSWCCDSARRSPPGEAAAAAAVGAAAVAVPARRPRLLRGPSGGETAARRSPSGRQVRCRPSSAVQGMPSRPYSCAGPGEGSLAVLQAPTPRPRVAPVQASPAASARSAPASAPQRLSTSCTTPSLLPLERRSTRCSIGAIPVPAGACGGPGRAASRRGWLGAPGSRA
mmetsp:Transcript_97157/g.313760  ORF Transcript_97157/g.313760 Transcript_97157/m.313760 type:complete len:477 (+) Transcript_97157:483-1913(+)